ncbi:hypothetical protein AM493_11770 [Flavobacterium akiainvivens]|uniref:DUF1015 domain-containing protein n=1 Tax=Flavobacterium akiainvivens TaxID=1202724 RepID=A0A0M8M9X2_9FLAO|nr:DUF1015 domain-containing protein [Flavobacterium akiainvivens]KOS06633.1 hypothetical protein AM493_11770 [Flavobacterium akiainvivens]SFQ08610.1 Uncharacterized conserved protein, DUF1015 family [Flavobacterium akiainvivens]
MKIVPFKAVRPARDKVALVTTRSYDEYTPAELASQLDYNPFSFLHVLNPAYLNQQKLSEAVRFKAVHTRYTEFKDDEVLRQEATPVFYLYEIQSKSRVFTGIIAGTAIEDYKQNRIKKHEDTLPYRVEYFKDYLHQTGFNTEPVLVTYPQHKGLEEWIIARKQRRPLYLFSSLNRDKHTLWRIRDEQEIAWIQEQFSGMESLYIADGHHRSASSELLFDQYGQDGNASLGYFMSFLICESNLKIYEYNRVVSGLNGLSARQFVEALEVDFEVTNRHLELWKPEQKFEFGMYLEDEFYSLKLRDTAFKSVLEALDAQILYDKILHPLLGITDLRNDGRIDYIPGSRPITTIKETVDEGHCTVGFMLYPASIDEIKQLADNDLIMPPKSTYIEPKLRSGLVVYEL